MNPNQKKPKNGISFLLVLAVGAVGLIVLFGYLSSHDVIPTLEQFSAQNGLSTSTQGSLEKALIEASGMQASSTEATAPAPAPVSASSATATTAALPVQRKTTTIKAPKGTVTAQISNTPALRELGLSGRSSLGTNEGMVFIFPQAGAYSFWMKDMNFSLDMVWMDSSYKVVGVTSGVSPSSYPLTFLPPKDIQFVLELNAGAATRLGIATGTPLRFVP